MKVLNLIFFIAVILFKNLSAQVMWQIKDTENKKWYLQFNDEFDAEKLDETKWKSGMPWGNAQYVADNYFTPDNVVLSDHTLKLTSKKEPYKLRLTAWEIDSAYFKREKKTIPEYYTFDHTSGEISTRQQFKLGYFEIRFKTQKAYGMWPAFWLYGGAPNEEIDFFELKGERDNQIHVDMHCPDGCDNYRGGFLNLHRGWGGWVTAKDNLSEGWNIVSGEWQKDYVKLFLNGTPIAYFPGEFKTSQYLLIGTGPAKTGGAFSPGPNKTTPWPNQLEVDYVRVWSMEDTIFSNKDKYTIFEHTNKTIADNDLYKTELKKKLNTVYDKKALSPEKGTITLLPILYNKYSLSIAGKNLGKIQVEVLNNKGVKVAGYNLEKIEYYTMDLSELETGPYTIKIAVLNQTLTHQIPVINPRKLGTTH